MERGEYRLHLNELRKNLAAKFDRSPLSFVPFT